MKFSSSDVGRVVKQRRWSIRAVRGAQIPECDTTNASSSRFRGNDDDVFAIRSLTRACSLRTEAQSEWNRRQRCAAVDNSVQLIRSGSGQIDRCVALLPVARAQLIGLQCIEHAQHFLRVTADAAGSHVGELDDPVWINQERGASGDPFFLIKDAKGATLLLVGIGQHRELEVVEILEILLPRQVDELVVGTGGENLGIAISELRGQIGKSIALGWADKGEVLRIEKHQQPFAGIALVRYARKIQAVGGYAGLEVKTWKVVANGQHGGILLAADGKQQGRKGC